MCRSGESLKHVRSHEDECLLFWSCRYAVENDDVLHHDLEGGAMAIRRRDSLTDEEDQEKFQSIECIKQHCTN